MLDWTKWNQWENYNPNETLIDNLIEDGTLSQYGSNWTNDYINQLEISDSMKDTIRNYRDSYYTSTSDGSSAVSRGTAQVGNNHRNVW